MVKIELYLPHEELLDGMNRRPRSSIHRALTWRQRTPTAAAERTMSAAGVRTALEKSRQLSASLPTSSRASDGARVFARRRSGRRDNDWGVSCIYKDRDGATLLHRCPWRFTSEGHVAIMQTHWRLFYVPTHAWIVGWSFPLLRVSGKKD